MEARRDDWMAYQDGRRLLGKCIYLGVPLRWLVSVSVSGTRRRVLSVGSRVILGDLGRRVWMMCVKHASPVDR